MRAFVIVLALVGLALFGSAFVASYVNPSLVELQARNALEAEVIRQVGAKIDGLDAGGKLTGIVRRIAGQNSSEIADLRRKLSAGLPEKVARIAGQMRNPNCECRKAIERSMTQILEDRIASLERINERLELFIRTKYMNVAESLTREFRIFTGANALVFFLLATTAALRPRARLQLLLPAAVLIGAAVLVGYLYLFKQDWLHTVMFSDYVGLGYFGYLLLAVAMLADVVFNRARILTQLLNAAFNVVGASLQALPC